MNIVVAQRPTGKRHSIVPLQPPQLLPQIPQIPPPINTVATGSASRVMQRSIAIAQAKALLALLKLLNAQACVTLERAEPRHAMRLSKQQITHVTRLQGIITAIATGMRMKE